MFRLAIVALAAGSVAADRTRMEPDVDVFHSVNWIRGGRVTESETLKVEFWLKHDDADLADFHDTYMRLATPGNREYARWLSREEVVAKLSPSREALDSVLDFCVYELGATNINVNKFRSVVEVEVRARDVEKALETSLYHHTHHIYKKVDVVRAVEAYSLPAHVARHVSVVGELLRFPRMRFADPKLGGNAFKGLRDRNPNQPEVNISALDPSWTACGAEYATNVNPAVLAARYGFTYPFTSSAPENTVAVGEFQGEYYDDDDLSYFSTLCGLATPVTIATTVGGNSPQRCESGLEPCIESLLDIEYIGAIAGDIPLTVVYSEDYALLDYANTLSDMDSPPLVNSVSYGNDEVQQTGSDFMESVNTAFMKLGAMGVSILFAAGDQGVWGRSGVGATYHPDFPAGSPYVTAVGGTDFAEQTVIGEETAWADGGSGFSDEFPTAEWQTDEVAAYLKTEDLPKDSMYNAAGRGYPDVSALGGSVNPYTVAYRDGSIAAVSGTSASCPVVAGMIAQLNDARLAAGKPALGPLNPLLYQAGEAGAYNDVTTGKTSGGLAGGFPAAPGWDAATGYGTIIFDKLMAVAMDA